MNALFAGSFHPPTKGHLDIIKRSASLYDKVYVAVMYNAEKKYTLSADERIGLLQKMTAGMENVFIVSDTGLTAEFAKTLDCRVLIRGLRNSQDFEYEKPIADANKQIFGIETMFLPCDPNYTWISSTILNDVLRHGGDISKMVPESIHEDILRACTRTSKGV